MLAQGVVIQFAHRTFQWQSAAKGKAAVHCVIVGFGNNNDGEKKLFSYDDIKGPPTSLVPKNINPYLVDAANILLSKRSLPICEVPEITKGSEATDFGHLFLNQDERNSIVKEHPSSAKWLKKVLGADEFINNEERYCFWLVEVTPSDLKSMDFLRERLQKVKDARLASAKARTREWAQKPYLFSENRQPKTTYLAIPKVSSEKRSYLPVGFLEQDLIATGSLQVIPSAELFHFGVLCSVMHMSWMRQVCGRMKSDYQYSNTIVYNNFPWPLNPTPSQKQTIEAAAQAVLDARAAHPTSSLADLYDPLTMPANLTKAHQQLDKAVDAAYGKRKFATEAERVAFLFELYQQYTENVHKK